MKPGLMTLGFNRIGLRLPRRLTEPEQRAPGLVELSLDHLICQRLAIHQPGECLVGQVPNHVVERRRAPGLPLSSAVRVSIFPGRLGPPTAWYPVSDRQDEPGKLL